MKAKIDEIVEMLDMQSDEMHCFLNTVTGEPFFIDDQMHSAIEDEEDFDGFTDWQIEEIQKAKEIFDSEYYLELPDKFEINEYKIMENFCLSLKDNLLSKKLLAAIKGKGVFRKFKDALYEQDLLNDWTKFRDKALKEFIISWCKDNDLEIL